MSRILLAWELGLNFGHLARLVPPGLRLKARGHMVLAAVRDPQAAAIVLEPAKIPFVQAPRLGQGIRLSRPPGAYVDILLAEGWLDRDAMRGLVQGWLNLFRMFQPDLVVLDHSPTALLSAHIANIPAMVIGNGFELPPLSAPLPPFPGFPQDRVQESEHAALANANTAISRFGGTRLDALRDLFQADARLLATFPELDHYGVRADAQYVGPLIGKTNYTRVEWPDESGARVFACLRPDTRNVDAILEGLALSGANVLCVAPGFTRERLERFSRSRIRFSTHLVALRPLLQKADVCVSYGAEGTIAMLLLAGVPQLIAPRHVEGYVSAQRIETFGAGLLLRQMHTPQEIALFLSSLIEDKRFASRARAFADKYRDFHPDQSADRVCREAERIVVSRQ